MKKQLTRIFITTYEDDYLWLKFLLLSLEKYAKGFSGITIVCDDNKSKIPQTTLDIIQTMPLDVQYVTPPSQKPPAMKIRLGYMWQQVIKLQWWKYCEEDICVQIDSDCIFKKTFTPDTFKNDEGKWIWHYRPWAIMNNTRWKPSTEELLRLHDLKNQGMIGRYFVLTRDCTQKLVEHITNERAENWSWDFCVNNNIEQFSEYCLYAAFIENIYHKHDYYLKMWKTYREFEQYSQSLSTKYWSYAGITPEIQFEYQSYIKNK